MIENNSIDTYVSIWLGFSIVWLLLSCILITLMYYFHLKPIYRPQLKNTNKWNKNDIMLLILIIFLVVVFLLTMIYGFQVGWSHDFNHTLIFVVKIMFIFNLIILHLQLIVHCLIKILFK